MKKSEYSLPLRLIILLLSLLLLTACSKKYPVIGTDPVNDIGIVEDHSEALVRWLNKGVREAVLINIDTHDDIRFISEENIQRIKWLVEKEIWRELEKYRDTGYQRLYGIGNFIYAAARLGIVNRVFWIIPFDYLKRDNASELLTNMLYTYRFFPVDISTFQLKDGCFNGTVRGIPFSICDLESLPVMNKPVLISIDADYLPVATKTYRKNYLTMVSYMINTMKNKHIIVKDVVISYSINGTYLSVVSKWVGDLVGEVISNPFIFNGGFKGRWLVYQNAQDMLDNNMLNMLNIYLESQLPYYKNDPVLNLYMATDLIGLKKIKRAKEFALRSCEIDRSYCAGLVHLAVILAAEGQIDKSVEFYNEYLKRNRNQFYGLVELGLLYYQKGKYDLAKKVFLHYSERMGFYPTGFVIGALHLKRGDTEGAGKLFDMAMADARDSLYISTNNEIISDAIERAITFYRTKGELKNVKFLEHILASAGD